jgi:hypothetical protein
MAKFNKVKFCYGCKDRFLIKPGEPNRGYCTKCQKKVDKAKKEHEEEEERNNK